MTNFVRVKEAPTDLLKDEFVIPPPNFLDFIKAAELKKPKNNVTTANYLRELVSAIGAKYVGEDFDAMREVNVAFHKGQAFSSEEDINNILIDLFKKHYPNMFLKYIEYHIQRRPSGVKIVYYTGDGSYNATFHRYGIQEMLMSELEVLQGKRVKKVPKKPFITNEQAELLNKEQ